MSRMNPATTETPTAEQVSALRGFNRFYTRRIGVLDPNLGGELSLTEVRVLYYAQRGFRLVKSEPYRGYGGHALVGETWELKL